MKKLLVLYSFAVLFFMGSCGNHSVSPHEPLPGRGLPVDTLFLDEPGTVHLLDTVHAIVTFPLINSGDTLMRYVVTSVSHGNMIVDTITMSLGRILDTVDTQQIRVSWTSTDTSLRFQIFLDNSALSGWMDSASFLLPAMQYPGAHVVSVIAKNPVLGEIVGITSRQFFVRATSGFLARGLRYVNYVSSLELSFDGQGPFKQWNALFSIDTAHTKIKTVSVLNSRTGWNFFLPDSTKILQPKFTVSIVVAPDNALKDTLRNVPLMSLRLVGPAEGVTVDSVWILP